MLRNAVILLVLVLISAPALAQDATEPENLPFDITIYISPDALTIYISDETQLEAIPLRGLGFFVQGQEPPTSLLENYPAFNLPIDRVPVPICFQLTRSDSGAGLPAPCLDNVPENRRIVQPLDVGDIFWFDHQTSTNMTVTLVQGNTVIDLCAAGLETCTFTYQLPPPTPTPVQPTPLPPTPVPPTQPPTAEPITVTEVPEAESPVLSSNATRCGFTQRVEIPAVTFDMGFAQGEKDEQPMHTVSLSPFVIDQYEVTNCRYEMCVDARACSRPDGQYYGNTLYLNYPVVYVSWDQAQAYCEWDGGRLPTEAEWEYIAQQDGSYNANHDDDGNRQNDLLMNVGSFPAGTVYGTADMSGNVFEWVQDWYAFDSYAALSAQGTMTLTDPTGPNSPDQNNARVIRGGAFNYQSYFLRPQNRDFASPVAPQQHIGFRCAYDLP